MDAAVAQKPRIKKARGAAASKKQMESTPLEYIYAATINDRHDLNLTYGFLRDRTSARQLIKCFGYHTDSVNAEETGWNRVRLLRHYYKYSSDLRWLADKLNMRFSSGHFLFEDDIDFMIKILKNSRCPLVENDLPADPEDFEYFMD